MGGIKEWNIIKRILGYCPYCIIGKQVVNKVSSNKVVRKKSEQNAHSEKRLIEGMKTGRNIALIGVFCPIFWLSLFMGESVSVLLFNAVHSSLFIFLGGTYFLINFIKFRKHQFLKVKQNDAIC